MNGNAPAHPPREATCERRSVSLDGEITILGGGPQAGGYINAGTPEQEIPHKTSHNEYGSPHRLAHLSRFTKEITYRR
jgi:hypothetical protein